MLSSSLAVHKRTPLILAAAAASAASAFHLSSSHLYTNSIAAAAAARSCHFRAAKKSSGREIYRENSAGAPRRRPSCSPRGEAFAVARSCSMASGGAAGSQKFPPQTQERQPGKEHAMEPTPQYTSPDYKPANKLQACSYISLSLSIIRNLSELLTILNRRLFRFSNLFDLKPSIIF